MNRQKTADIFNKYSKDHLTDEETEEIEQNLKEYFDIIVNWHIQETQNKGTYFNILG